MMHYSYDEGRKFDGRSVHAPELWTVCWDVGGDFGVVYSSFTGGTVPCVAHSGLSGTCLVCVEGWEAKRSMGVFSLAGDWTSPRAFVTTTLALIVHSPVCMRACEVGKSLCRISECVVAAEVNFFLCIAVE